MRPIVCHLGHPINSSRQLADLSTFIIHHSNVFPNPFNAGTMIRFGLPTSGKVRLTIYNLQGQQVVTLMNGFRAAGYYDVTWDASKVPSGLYFAKLTAGEFSAVRKLVLLK